MNEPEKPFAIYWRLNAGPIIISMIVLTGFAALMCRLLNWDYRLILLALIAAIGQEYIKYRRFVKTLEDCDTKPKE